MKFLGEGDIMKTPYKTLVGEIAKRGIKKKVIASRIGVSERTLYNKLNGDASFTWEEVCGISMSFFPDIDKSVLFRKEESEVAKNEP